MPAFQPPEMTQEMRREWFQEVKPEFADLQSLWGELWSGYNIMSVPVLNGADFFDNALAAAKQAKDRQDLGNILHAQYKERCRYLEDTMGDIAHSSLSLQTRFPSEDVRDAALKCGQSGSLDSLIRFVWNIISGWEAWEKEGKPPQICSTEDFDGGQIRNDDAQYDTSEDGRDPQEYDNSFPTDLDLLPQWNGRDSLRREVTECEPDEALSKRSDRLLSSTGEDDNKSAKGEETHENPTASSDLLFESSNTPPKSPIAHIASPKTHPPSLQPASNVLPSSTDCPSATSSPLSEIMSPRTSKKSPDFPDDDLVNTLYQLPNTTSPEEEPKGQPDSHAQSGGLATTRKRSTQENDDENVRDRKRRR